MFVENQNYADSLLFLGSARIALANIVKESSVKNKKEVINYIHKEASDYEIMHLLVRGEMSDEKFNSLDEAELWMEFKIQILGNRETVQEVVSDEIFANVLTEVDSIYPLQSAESLFEYSMELFKEEFVQEVTWGGLWDIIKKGGTAADIEKATSAGKGQVADLVKKVGASKVAARLKKAGDVAGGRADVIGKELNKAKQQLQSMAGEAGRGAAQMGAGFKKAGQEIGDKTSKFLAKKDLQVQRQMQSPGKRAAGDALAKAQQGGLDKGLKGDIAAKGAGERAQAARQAMQQGSQKLDKGLKADIAAKGAGERMSSVKVTPTKGTPMDPSVVSSSQTQTSKGFMDKIKAGVDSAKELASKYAPKLQKFATSPTGMAIGGAALGALAIYGATKAYKRFFSKAAKACGGMSGGDKSRCMNQYKVKGLQAQMADLKAGTGACKAAKNPDKCQAAITQKIASLQRKIGKLQSRGA